MTDTLLHHTPDNYTDDWRMAPHPLALDFVPTAIVNLFPRICPEKFPELDNYLRSRGISERTYKKFDVRASERGELVFLFTNLLNNVLGVVFRNISDKKIRGLKLELLELQGIQLPKKAKRGAWFGLHLIDITLPLLIVESELDVMKIHEWGHKNVVCPGGMSATKQQMKALYNKRLYVGFDSDKAGKEGMQLFLKNVNKDKEVWIVDWSLKGAKDPGDLTNSEDFYDCMNNAEKVR